jgi:hypothetical protein
VAEAVDGGEDQGDGSQEAEEHGEVEGYVDGEGCYYGFGEEHVDGSEEDYCHDVFEDRRWWERVAARFYSFGEDDFLVCLLREVGKDETEDREEYQRPFYPSLALLGIHI